MLGLKTSLTTSSSPQQVAINNSISCAFDGTNDFMELTAGLLDLSTKFTIGAWVKTTEEDGGIMSKYYSGSVFSFFFGLKGGKLEGAVNTHRSVPDSGTGVVTTSSGDVDDGNWKFCVMTWDNSVGSNNQKLYINGILDGQATNDGSYNGGDALTPANSVHSSSSAILVGANGYFLDRTDGTIAGLRGGLLASNIDEVAVWDEALTADEISSLYNGGKAVALDGTFGDYNSNGNLLLWLRMGDSEFDTHADTGLGLIRDVTNTAIGDNLIDDDKTYEGDNWTNNGDFTIVEASDSIKFTYGSNSTAYLPLNATTSLSEAHAVNKISKLTATFTTNDATNPNLALRNEASGTRNMYKATVDTGSKEIYFPSSHAVNDRIYIQNLGSGDYVQLSNVVYQQLEGRSAIMHNMTASDMEDEAP